MAYTQNNLGVGLSWRSKRRRYLLLGPQPLMLLGGRLACIGHPSFVPWDHGGGHHRTKEVHDVRFRVCNRDRTVELSILQQTEMYRIAHMSEGPQRGHPGAHHEHLGVWVWGRSLTVRPGVGPGFEHGSCSRLCRLSMGSAAVRISNLPRPT